MKFKFVFITHVTFHNQCSMLNAGGLLTSSKAISTISESSAKPFHAANVHAQICEVMCQNHNLEMAYKLALQSCTHITIFACRAFTLIHDLWPNGTIARKTKYVEYTILYLRLKSARSSSKPSTFNKIDESGNRLSANASESWYSRVRKQSNSSIELLLKLDSALLKSIDAIFEAPSISTVVWLLGTLCGR